MAIKTQLRTAQLTGSYGTTAGLINDQGSAVASGSAAAADLGAILSQVASAVKRINGADSFSEQNAGVFTHATSTFSGDLRVNGNDIQASDGAATITMAGRDVTLKGDLQLDGHDIKNSSGEVTLSLDADQNVTVAADLNVNGGDVVIKAANDAGATLNLQADNADDNGDTWLVGAQTTQALGLLNNISGSPVAMFSIVPHATAAQSVTTVSGKLKVSGLEIQNADGEACITIDADQNASIAADLTVLGGKVTLTNGAIIDSETAGKIKLTEDLVECSADLTVLGNDLDFAAANAQIGATVGANVLSLGGATSTVAALNDLRVDGNILADANEAKAIFSAVTSADITIGNGATIVIPGNLTVNGTTTTIDTTHLLVKDPVIQLAHGAQSLNTNQGLLFGSGSATAARPDVAFGRVANDTWGIGSIANPDSGSITTVAGMTMDVGMRAAVFEVAGATNTIDVSATNMRMVAAVDIILDPAGGDVSVDGNVSPLASNGGALGAVGAQWSDLFLAEGGVINFDNGDVTMTQTGDLLDIAGGNTRVARLEIDSAADYIDVDTNLQIVAAADILLDANGNDVAVQGSGGNPFQQLNRAGAGESYVNFSTNDGAGMTAGSGGFGFRNNAGTMQFKNSGGSWANFGSSTNATAAKETKELASPINAATRVFGTGNGLDISSFLGGEDNGRIDLFVNGQLMLSGGTAASITKDYALDVTDGRADCDVKINFALVADDVVTLSVK